MSRTRAALARRAVLSVIPAKAGIQYPVSERRTSGRCSGLIKIIGDDAVRQAVQAEQAGVVAQDIYPGLGVLTIGQICQALGMSRSGYYARRAAAKQRLAEPAVCAQSVHLKAAFAASYKACGSRRLRTAMAERGQPMGRHRVRTLMRLNGLRPVWRRKFVRTTDSKHGLAVSPNVLNRRFEQALPNQVWVADITYIRMRSGWLYLAAVLDLHSRKIVGWAMAPSMPAGLVCTALQMAIVQRNPAPGLIVHSDRGTQYASAEHPALLGKHGLVGSMSRKGNCWLTDRLSAVMERFFLNLKMERVWHKEYANHNEAINDIADYIVGFYNSIRLHSKLGNMSPNAFERESTSKKSIKLSEIT